MASKYERITDLYLQTAGEVATPEVWPRFLTTACYNFRLSFDKQVLLYAQRPDATAVLPIEGRQGWNQRFGRWVNRGSKGIAILDSGSNGQKELFSKVRSGQVRVLIGSTAKMGAGTNCQDKLIALHDADCPWRPSDLAQRLGRIVRQGNQNPEVEIFRYVTENTFDAYLYQLVENKQKFIAQIMTSKAPARIADDVDETALSYSEIKALATGNPLIIEKCNLDVEVSKLNMLKANHLNQRFALENLVLRKYPADIAKLTEAIAGYEKDVETAKAHPKPAEGFIGMEIKGTHYSEKEAAGRAVINACTELQGSDPVSLGHYRGFPCAALLPAGADFL